MQNGAIEIIFEKINKLTGKLTKYKRTSRPENFSFIAIPNQIALVFQQFVKHFCCKFPSIPKNFNNSPKPFQKELQEKH